MMNIRNILLLLSLTVICQAVPNISKAQLQSISIEGLGAGPIYSIQYESRFKDMNKGHGYRVGLSAWQDSGDRLVTLPIGYNFLFTKNHKSFIEVGLGITTLFYNKQFGNGKLKEIGHVFGNFQAGYRSTIKNTNFYWRAVWSPIITDDYQRLLYAGLSFGYQWIR